MSKNIVEELPARKHAPAAAPVATKKGRGDAKGGASSESSEKKIRQAVYDIRYRARREDIDLKAAFAQYMSNSSLSQQERTAVRAKLFGKEGGGVKEQFTVGADDWAIDGVSQALYKVFVEKTVDENIELSYLNQLNEDEDNRKYKVRVKDKNGKTYVRYADRAKITQLRQNPNIQSVEMTEHGEPYEGERKKKPGKLDPVGKEDADVDNDGDVDKSDKYILNRRKKIGQAIRTRAEAYLADGTVTTEPPLGSKKITGKGVDNYASGAVKVNPDDQSSKEPKKTGVYAHLELKGNELSEAQIKMMKLMSVKKKKDEEKEDDMATKDMSKGSCPPDEEREDDDRDKYAKINLIKNKLRSMGKRDPQVMMVSSPTKGQKLNMYGEDLKQEVKNNDSGVFKTVSTNIKTTDNPKGGVRNKNKKNTYPSGLETMP